MNMRVQPGYTGGSKTNPAYDASCHCSGDQPLHVLVNLVPPRTSGEIVVKLRGLSAVGESNNYLV